MPVDFILLTTVTRNLSRAIVLLSKQGLDASCIASLMPVSSRMKAKLCFYIPYAEVSETKKRSPEHMNH
jgi:hypothetical protein